MSQNETNQSREENPSEEARERSEEDLYSSHFIGHYEKAPQFMVDNTNITDGYRINFNTPSRIIKSLFMIHNESVNIWSHCLRALFFIFILISFMFVIEGESFRASFTQHRLEIQLSMHTFHLKLKNLSLGQEFQKYQHEAEEEIQFLKISILEGYQELLENVDQKSLKMRELIESNLKDFKTSIKDDLLHRLHQFEKSKRKFQKEIAPRVVEQFGKTFNGSFVLAFKEHIEQLKQHLDSSVFNAMELHEETPNIQHISKWPIFVFLLSAVICLLNSTFFHLFHPMSSKTYGLLLRFDFAGISLLIAGSAFPSFYYGLYCQMAVAAIYLTWAFGAAVICFVICLFEWIHKQGNEKYRSLVFGSFGMSMIVPFSHMIINEVVFDNYGDPYEFSSSGVYYVLLSASYIFGLYVFTVRCPERNNPGRYNICGHSHQIWHVMVVLGIIFTYLGVMENFEMRKVSVFPA